MTRYADPRRCPDCRSAIAPGDAACGTCRLSLRGETAQRLFTTLALADDLLGLLRAASTPLPAAATAPPAPAEPRRSRLSAASVPTILLGLGAGCLLVAALVFLAVTWSALGVGGRTAVLVLLTVVAGGLAAWAARRGLRAAAESLSVVGLGLLSLDLVGADHAGWFGDVSVAGFCVLLGAVLLSTGAAAAVAAARATSVRLIGAEVVSALGLGVLTAGLVVGDWLPVGPLLVLGTLVSALVCAGVHRLALRVTTAGAAGVTALAWLALTGYGAERTIAPDVSWRALWVDLDVWPLLVAAALVAALALARRLPLAARIGAAAVAHLLVVVAVLAPAQQLAPTQTMLVALGVLAGAAAATWWLPGSWALVNLVTQGVTAAGILLVTVVMAVESLARISAATGPVWSGGALDRLGRSTAGDIPGGWMLPLCLVALAGTAWVLLRTVQRLGHLAKWRLPDGGTWAVAVLAGSVVAGLALYPVPLWSVVAALVLATAGLTARWLTDRRAAPLGLASCCALAAVLVALHADRLTAVVLALVVVHGALVHLRARADEPATLAGAALAGAAGGSAWTWGAIGDVPAPWAALAAVVVVGVLVLVAPTAPARWWQAARPVRARAGLEVGAAIAAVLATATGVDLAPAGQTSSWTAVYLTALGVVVTIVSLQREDRRPLGWIGGLLLAAATWVRLFDLGVRAPEAYTLPSAAALLVVGLAHLRRHPGSSTWTTLAPGISLAVAPSLLWVLVEPTGPRALLLGLGCLVLVLVGARLGWTAPLVIGATAGSVLVLRLAAPYVADAVPRWVLIGAAGALLLAVGATWERRIGEARRMATYVRALR